MDFGRSIARFLFLSIVFVSQLFFPRPAHAQSGDTLSDNKVHFEVMPYLVFGGISGDLTIRGQTLPVDASAGDVLSNLNAGFMGRAALSYNRWFAASDVIYMGLGGTSTFTGPGGVASVAVNVTDDQWLAEALDEGRFPDNRTASARFRFRPGVDYTLPLRMKRRPALVVSNEFFIVPGTNSFAAGGSFTQNRFQVGVRLPITDSFSRRPYYLLQSVNLPAGWDTNEIIGISLAVKFFIRTNEDVGSLNL